MNVKAFGGGAAAALGVVALAAVAVLPLEYVATVTEFMNDGTSQYVPTGWHYELADGRTLDYRNGPALWMDWPFDIVTNGTTPASFVADTEVVEMPTPTNSLAMRGAGSDSTGWLVLLFDNQLDAAPKPLKDIDPNTPLTRITIARDSLLTMRVLDYVGPSEATRWTVDPDVEWWVQFARVDPVTGREGRPSPLLHFTHTVVSPPPPPTTGLLVGTSWTGDHTLYLDFADTVLALTASEIQLSVDGQDLGLGGAPVAEGCCRWRQWRGSGAKVPGSWLAVVRGDSLAWIEP